VVLNGQGVGQLDAEEEPLPLGFLLKLPDQLHRPGVLQVVLEDPVGDGDLPEAQVLVEDPQEGLLPQQGGVELHRQVQAPLLQQVGSDPADLVGGTAVHGREGAAVRHSARDLQVRQLGQETPDRRAILLDQRGGVRQRLHEAPHPGLEDPLQVVAHAHVEDRTRGTVEAQDPVQQVDQDPGGDVLPSGLLQPELLGPLHVVSLVGHVDAGPGNLQLVVDLDGLQLDEPGPGAPGGDDVPGELGVGARGGAHRGLEGLAEEPGDVGGLRVGAMEQGPGDAEQGVVPPQLRQDPAELLLEGLDPHLVSHRSSSHVEPR
jgi:hypothetical protein